MYCSCAALLLCARRGLALLHELRPPAALTLFSSSKSLWAMPTRGRGLSLAARNNLRHMYDSALRGKCGLCGRVAVLTSE